MFKLERQVRDVRVRKVHDAQNQPAAAAAILPGAGDGVGRFAVGKVDVPAAIVGAPALNRAVYDRRASLFDGTRWVTDVQVLELGATGGRRLPFASGAARSWMRA